MAPLPKSLLLRHQVWDMIHRANGMSHLVNFSWVNMWGSSLTHCTHTKRQCNLLFIKVYISKIVIKVFDYVHIWKVLVCNCLNKTLAFVDIEGADFFSWLKWNNNAGSNSVSCHWQCHHSLVDFSHQDMVVMMYCYLNSIAQWTDKELLAIFVLAIFPFHLSKHD